MDTAINQKLYRFLYNRKATLNILAGLLLASLCLWAATTNMRFIWLAAIFFVGIPLLILMRQYSKTGLFRKPGKKKTGDETINNSEGIFTYTDAGFRLLVEQKEHSVEWKQVRSMVAYKMDRFASDDLAMDVFCDEGVNFTISEETVGWNKFLDNSKTALPSIAKLWEIEMATPGPESVVTLVYDYKNRSLDTIRREYYID